MSLSTTWQLFIALKKPLNQYSTIPDTEGKEHIGHVISISRKSGDNQHYNITMNANGKTWSFCTRTLD